MGVFDAAAGLVRRLGPLGVLPARAIELYGEGLRLTEQTALRLLRSRMDSLVPPSALQLNAGSSPAKGAAGDPVELMASLMSRSLEQDTASGRQAYYVTLLEQLLPDEARIFAALATGPPQPLVSVYRRSNGELLLANASLAGRTAAVTLPSMTPKYLTKLLALGLAELGPEDTENEKGYELVMADGQVRSALKAGELSKVPAKVVRRTVTLGAHGKDLWLATRPDSDLA